jgi:hypothetical protein
MTGDDLDRDPIGGKSGQGRLGALLWRIQEGGEAHKDQFRRARVLWMIQRARASPETPKSPDSL